VSFFGFFSWLPPQSGWCLSNPPVLFTPFLTIPPLHRSSLLLSTFNLLLSNSLLHVANASSSQLPPADAYTLPRSHTHHLLLRLRLGTRLYGHVTYEREGVCRVLASSRAGTQYSVFNPVLSRTKSRMKWWWHSLPPSLHVTLVPFIKNPKRCSKRQCFVRAQPTSVRLMSWFLSWMKGLGLELESCCADFRGLGVNLNICNGQL